MDLVVSGMGGGLKEDQVAKELRALGLKWGQLTSGQVSGPCVCVGGGTRTCDRVRVRED